MNSPLVDRNPADIFAWIANSGGSVQPVTVADFLRDVQHLADQLPVAQVAINLCQNRYRFTVAFCAVIVAGQANALPPSHHVDVQERIAKELDGCYVLHDGVDTAPGLKDVKFINEQKPGNGQLQVDDVTVPQIPLNQPSAICFTSGSTGAPTSTQKTWRTLKDSSIINAHYYLSGVDDRPLSILATVPPQHMYGLEASVLLPLVCDVSVHYGHPLFPDDIRRCLGEIPAPRVFVSTPVHFRAILQSGVALPAAVICLSATAPLERDLAQSVSRVTGARIIEIYGCSEAGSMASRSPPSDNLWRGFDGFQFIERESITTVQAVHLVENVELQDILEFETPNRFRLIGRHTDMVNIAGKRGSLSQLSALLCAMPGVKDGIVFNLDAKSDGHGVGRLAAVVAVDSVTAADIRRWFREKTDAAFVPRTIRFVEALPRAGTGKLPREDVIAAFQNGVEGA